MKLKDQLGSQMIQYISLMLWIVLFLAIGWGIGTLTQLNVETWYAMLFKSPLTPPDYLFGVAWTILYILLAISGWLLWTDTAVPLSVEKMMYAIQMLCNWSWAPVFFIYHSMGMALIIIIAMVCLTVTLLIRVYHIIPLVSCLLLPYIGWISFAGYLNWYVWYYN